MSSTLLDVVGELVDAIESGNATLEFRTDLLTNQGDVLVSGNGAVIIGNTFRILIRPFGISSTDPGQIALVAKGGGVVATVTGYTFRPDNPTPQAANYFMGIGSSETFQFIEGPTTARNIIPPVAGSVAPTNIVLVPGDSIQATAFLYGVVAPANALTVSITAIRVELKLNDTTDDKDDFVVVSPASHPNRPFTPLTVGLKGNASGQQLQLDLRSAGVGQINFTPNSLTLVGDGSATVKVFGDTQSRAENDTSISVRVNEGSTSLGVASEDLTVIEGIKVRFSGTFLFMVENNNGLRTSNAPEGSGVPIACGGEADPEVWGNTPLECEGLHGFFREVYFEEGQTSAERFSLASGLRPRIETLVSGVKSFDPEVDLDGRDNQLKSGVPVKGFSGISGRSRVGVMVADNCDNDLNTPGPSKNPLGQEEGVETITNFGIRFGDSFSLKYLATDDSRAKTARIWTAFPSGGITPTDRTIDTNATNTTFFPTATGCTSQETYFGSSGTFQCQHPQTVKELFLRTAGFRSSVKRAWANWTSRTLAVNQEGQFQNSFIARLFDNALKGQPANANTTPDDDVFAETFMQFFEYDWYTLMGKVTKGVASTPGGIHQKYEEHSSSTCPLPPSPQFPREPDEVFTDDPWFPPTP